MISEGASATRHGLEIPSQRPVAKILIAVWGQTYIDRFELLGLSSVLSQGNLPALAKVCDVEFVFLTRRKEFENFDALPLLNQIRQYASVRYEAIDDLIVPGLYTVTLTLAFTRGMRIFGEDMTKMYFIYWNADFVIGDGSLDYVRRCIEGGRKVVLAGSVRVISEEVEPLLLPRTGADGILRQSPRELTQYLFEHPHLMQVAKTVDQELCWARYPNHLFWTAGEDAIVARFFQIFMFCLRPTRARTTIDGYCDYSFVPAFCPDEPIHVVGDSDDVCLLEMQGRWQEAEDVYFGGGRTAAWLHNMQEWCTPEHAQIARQPIVYHAGDLPEDLSATIAESADYIEWCLSQIREPSPYPGHYYWVHGVAAWRLRRTAEQTLMGWPPELEKSLPLGVLKHPSFRDHHAEHVLAPTAPPKGLLQRLKRRLLGEAPEIITRLHPDAAALRPLVEAAAEAQGRLDTNPQYRLLLVTDLGGWIDRIFPLRHGRVFRTEPMIAATWRLEPSPAVDEVVIYKRGVERPGELEAAMKNAAAALKPGGRMTVLCHYPIYDDIDPIVVNRDRLSFAVAPLNGKEFEEHHAGGWRLSYANILLRLGATLQRRNPVGLARGLVGTALAVVSTVLRGHSGPTHAAWIFTARKRDFEDA